MGVRTRAKQNGTPPVMKRRSGRMQEIGHSGLDEWSGIIRQDFLRELNGREGYKRYNEMRLNSPVIGALLAAIQYSFKAVSFDFSSEDGPEDPRLEFLNDALKKMSHSWDDHITEAMTVLPFGFAPFTVNYKREAGRIYWRKLKLLGQDTINNWIFDEGGGLRGLQQYQHLWPDPIPIERMLLYRINVERNNPEGRSILRTSWIPYYYAKNLMQIEAIGEERGLAGLPVIKLPDGADTSESGTDMTKAKEIVRNIRQDEQAGLVLPHGWEIELLSSGVNRAFQTDVIIKRYESRMLMGALAQFLLLGQDRVGALATFEGGVDFFTLSINAMADMLADTWTRHIIPRLLRLNGIPTEGISLTHTDAAQTDVVSVGEFLAKIGGNVTWTAEDEQWLRGIARMPEKTLEELEGIRAEQEAARQEALARLQQTQSGEGEEDDEDPENMGLLPDVDYFVSSRAPDDDERRKQERRYRSKMVDFLNKQKRRVDRAIAKVEAE